jgi:SOS-response transcriptional repressor LexA
MLANYSYIKFLSDFQKIESANTSKGLDLVGESLLGYIAVHFAKGLTLTVTECMRISTVASPATIHRKISDLIEQGWIESVYEGENRRTKYLAPTAKAVKYFEKVSKLVSKSAT